MEMAVTSIEMIGNERTIVYAHSTAYGQQNKVILFFFANSCSYFTIQLYYFYTSVHFIYTPHQCRLAIIYESILTMAYLAQRNSVYLFGSLQ